MVVHAVVLHTLVLHTLVWRRLVLHTLVSEQLGRLEVQCDGGPGATRGPRRIDSEVREMA